MDLNQVWRLLGQAQLKPELDQPTISTQYSEICTCQSWTPPGHAARRLLSSTETSTRKKSWLPISGLPLTSMFSNSPSFPYIFFFTLFWVSFFRFWFCTACFILISIFFLIFNVANSFWTRKRWMWCILLTRRKASLL